MTRVSIYDPFADVFPTLFRSLLSDAAEPRTGERDGAAQAVPMRVDVSEVDGAYTVRADLPGVPKDAIHVDIDGNRVTIRAEVKREAERKEGERVLRSERYYGQFARSFALGDELDDERAAARFENGVLELTLPKKAVAGAKRLAIQ
ncbi:MAG TPA: Hsp20/alpha crystallin family protein [Burkholderiaceae bacterium]|nr:Hsp20/alpha crystallin family protein [Burkholderiaceae bacterium]